MSSTNLPNNNIKTTFAPNIQRVDKGVITYKNGTQEATGNFSKSKYTNTYEGVDICNINENEVLKPKQPYNYVKPERSGFDQDKYKYTKACNNVINKINGSYGVCTNPNCTYAHSFNELKVTPCMYALRCTKRSTPFCSFIHPNETVEQYYNRTKKVKPDLPVGIKKDNNSSSLPAVNSNAPAGNGPAGIDTRNGQDFMPLSSVKIVSRQSTPNVSLNWSSKVGTKTEVDVKLNTPMKDPVAVKVPLAPKKKPLFTPSGVPDIDYKVEDHDDWDGVDDCDRYEDGSY
jgi:hypothetical protein